MQKHVMRLIGAGVFLLTASIMLYFYFQPKEAAVVANNYIAAKDVTLTYENAADTVTDDNDIHYFWLCDLENADCVYVRDYVIKPLATELDDPDFSMFEYVDFKEAPDSVHYRSNTWGVNYYPAFVAVQNVDGKMSVLSALSWEKDKPFDSEDLKSWMYENGIWSGVFEQTEKIAAALQ